MDTATTTPPPATMQAIVEKTIYQQLQNVLLDKGPSAARDPDCSICILPIEESECILKHETCGNSFHAECLLEWLKGKCSCPMCRGCLKTHGEDHDRPLAENDDYIERFVSGDLRRDLHFDAFAAQLNEELNAIFRNDEEHNREVREAEIQELLFSLYEDEEYRPFLQEMGPFLRTMLEIMSRSDALEAERHGFNVSELESLNMMVHALQVVLARPTIENIDNEGRWEEITPQEHGDPFEVASVEFGNEDSTTDGPEDDGVLVTAEDTQSSLRIPNRLDIQSDHQYETLLRTSGLIEQDMNNAEESGDNGTATGMLIEQATAMTQEPSQATITNSFIG